MSRLKAEIHPFLTEEVVGALNAKNIHGVLDFIRADTQKIIKSARLNFREVLAIRNFLLRKFSAAPTNGVDCYKSTRDNATIIATGIKGVDQLLDGGCFTGNIYEICGCPEAGKTHLVLTILKNVISNTNLHVHLFDTKNDFSATRMKNMLNEMEKERQLKCLEKIIVKKTYTRHDLINGLYDIKNASNILKLRLIIIDSLPGVLLNSNDSQTNNAYLNHLVNIMRYLATEHHVAFLITNLIRTWNDGDIQQDKVENIACGRYWSTIPNTRLKIEKDENQPSCKVTVLSSDVLFTKINQSVHIELNNEGFL